MIKKLLEGIVITLAILVGPIPIMVSAQTTTTTASAQVQAMIVQIQNLQAQLSVLTTARANVVSTLELIRGMRQGMSGEDVSVLQAILAADPSIYPEGIISGFYGKSTAEAVKRFQKKNGFEQVGFVGPKTLKKLNESIKQFGLSHEDDDNHSPSATSTKEREKDRSEHGKRLCIPPGHMIAPGWLKKHDKPVLTLLIPLCNSKRQNENEHSIIPDTTAPVISAVGTANLMGTTTSITWTTDENATSKVWFGTTNPLILGSSSMVSNGTLVTFHSMPLSGLATSTIYFYIVVSSDSSGNTATSTQSSFLTTSGL